MKKHLEFFRQGALCLVMALACFGRAHAQDQRNVVKVGYMVGSYEIGTGMLAYERAIGSKFSIQPSVAFGFNKYVTPYSNSRNWAFDIGAEGRYYFILQRGYLLSGFYSGAYTNYEYHKNRFYQRGATTIIFEISGLTIGIPLGYQHAFLHGRLHIDGGVRVGYRVTGNSFLRFDPPISNWYEGPNRNIRQLDILGHLQVGFAF